MTIFYQGFQSKQDFVSYLSFLSKNSELSAVLIDENSMVSNIRSSHIH